MIVTKHTQRRYSHNNKKIYKMQQNKNIGKTDLIEKLLFLRNKNLEIII